MGKKISLLKSLSLLGLSLTLTAQNPWAIEVVSYTPGTTAYSGYQDPDTALGRPTVDTYTDYTQLDPDVAVVPLYAPWDFSELVSIGEGGSLVVKLGMPLTDDPAHPYGIDLLVFPYTFISGTGNYDQYTQDPTLFTLPDAESIGLYADGKAGKVSLSADGVTWFDFPASEDFMRLLPTLGRVWTGTAWGDPTDPTFPPNPDITLTDLAGMNLAELCRRYRGGAGGTGFDLADLIPPQSGSLPSTFEYVRISVPDDGNANTNLRIEIDAVTVVAPVSAYTRWTQKEFDWVDDPVFETPEANPESDPFTNWQEFARGGDPQVEETSLWLPQITLSSDSLSYTLPQTAGEAPWVLQASEELGDRADWQKLSPQPTAADSVSEDEIHRALPIPQPAAEGTQFYRLLLEDPL
ncbi:hypothetical protein P0Y35_15045 [Kiritimatiellaeota bacterium B1221]|nr:hypothetical protein [Kiritimatiellaeota bacterium B1221]